ncbi:MAG: hypothetical protein JNK46_08415 [Methylobacteriaceae bacterium]|nr:hypothetical protein [Methylobacteriaceae bacterium]
MDRRVIYWGLGLSALLAAPIVAVLAMQSVLFMSCSTEKLADGVLSGHIAWRITRMQCGEGADVFYDVAIGAEDKTLTTALTSRGSPAPVEVVRLEEGIVGVRLDRPPTGGVEGLVKIGLRRSGSPKERIDLQERQAFDGGNRPGRAK